MNKVLLKYLEHLHLVLLCVAHYILHDVVAVLTLGQSKCQPHQDLHHLHPDLLITARL